MRTLLVVSLLAVAALALSDAQRWASFKKTYGRSYAPSEEAARYAIFRQNLRKAEELNKVDTAHYGVTRFSDLTTEEFLRQYTGLNATSNSRWLASLKPFPHTTPKNTGTDWLAAGVVTSIKDQGSCGSCWAFSSVAAAEGCLGIKAKKPGISLSVQQVIDCCPGPSCNGGCSGGMEYDALEWEVTQDLASEDDYPYTGYQGECQEVTGDMVALPANTCDFYKVDKAEQAMREALEHSTVTVALDGTQLQSYSSGVISRCSGKSLNHALLLVSDLGDYTRDEKSYVIKNSWGPFWGEKGFFRMVQDANCLGIAEDSHSLAY